VVWLIKLNKVQFDSMTFQERNGTCGMKPKRSGRNLAEKSGKDRDLKWDEICSVLFCFLNLYGMFRPFRAKRNGIDNLNYPTSNWLGHVFLFIFIQFYTSKCFFFKLSRLFFFLIISLLFPSMFYHLIKIKLTYLTRLGL
jgi:hypothetical protein